MKKFLSFLSTIAVAGCFSSCNDALVDDCVPSQGTPITLSAQLQQEYTTRVNDQGFVRGDRMGIYIVDYINGAPGALDASANRASNVLYTFSYKWTAPIQFYWKDSSTPIDVYGYYPGINNIDIPTAYNFEVSYLQNIVPEDGGMSNYEASDFLWGKTAKVSPTEQAITVKYSHRMAGVWVYLKAGEGITATEWEKLDKVVQIENTVRTATINLTDGVPVPSGEVDKGIAMLPQSGDSYRAVIVPQKVAANKKLISVTLDGITYTHSLASEMDYMMGKIHNFTIIINKVEASGDYELKVSYDGITDWVNDETSHAFSSTAYVVIHCPKMGTLKQCLTDAGYDYTTMQNLKVTGELTTKDFEFLNREMTSLMHLNLKEAIVKRTYHSYWIRDEEGLGIEEVEFWADDALPVGAFLWNQTIRSIILPSSLKRVGNSAFESSNLMNSTLEIPEGVTDIDGYAFYDAGYYNNNAKSTTLVLPKSLKNIGYCAFYRCKYTCELGLSDNITSIEAHAFEGTENFYGVFHYPSMLMNLPNTAFGGLGSNESFTGEIELPQGVKKIPEGAFTFALKNRINLKIPVGVTKIDHAAFHGLKFASLKFNDDLIAIGEAAFEGGSIPFQITLPPNLLKIGSRAFRDTNIKGELVIPDNVEIIGSNAFSGCNLTKINIPERIVSIEGGAFHSVGPITEITIPKYVGYIGDGAFGGNPYMQRIICLNPEPPTLSGNPFEDLYLDKVVLQVPKQSVDLYRDTDGWSRFQNITAYCELAFNVPEIITMDKGTTRTGILRSEGAWEVAECPSWVTVSPSSGNDKKTEVTVTVHQQSQGETREGQIVFRLKEMGYTTYATVKQVATDVEEDETIVLQEASADAPYSVPIFLVGDGYNAEDIASGMYLQDMREQMEHLFSIEPYKTYRNYFTVSTAIACSPESGTNEPMKFKPDDYRVSETDMVWKYALVHGKDITEAREAYATILVLYNTNVAVHSTDINDSGRTISWVGKSTDSYPFDQRGYILHELGGTAFAKLGPEGVRHFNFMRDCSCPRCNMIDIYNNMRSKGWYQNVSTSAKISEVPWSHYIFHEKYAPYVDIYEGALNHSRSTYRSENMSVMGNTYIPYYNTISREIIVRRIMECAGLPFSMEDFLAKDKIELPEELVNNYEL